MTPEPSEEQVREALRRADAEWPVSRFIGGEESQRDLDALKVLAQALRRERERVKELEVRMMVLRSALENIASKTGREPDHSHFRFDGLDAQDGYYMGFEECEWDHSHLAKEALSSSAGKHHLELDALKDRVVEAAKELIFTQGNGEVLIECTPRLARQLVSILSALEAKEKEGVK